MLARGKTIRECCKELDVSWTTLRQWINKDEKLNQQKIVNKDWAIKFTLRPILGF